MAYTSLKKILDQQLADIRAAGLYKHERPGAEYVREQLPWPRAASEGAAGGT
jgi:hypothetical protein